MVDVQCRGIQINAVSVCDVGGGNWNLLHTTEEGQIVRIVMSIINYHCELINTCSQVILTDTNMAFYTNTFKSCISADGQKSAKVH